MSDRKPPPITPPRRSAVPPTRSPAEALEPTRPPPRPRGARRRSEARRLSPGLRALNGFLTFCVIIMGAIGAIALWIDHEFEKAGPLSQPKTVVVRRGDSSREIAQRLEAEGAIASSHVFVAYIVARSALTLFGRPPLQLKAGDYQLDPGQSVRAIANEIAEGRSVLTSVTIPEGLTSHQIVERLRAETSLTGTITVVPPEGSLLPDTYKLPRGSPRTAVIELMQQESRKLLAKAWEERAPNLPYKSMDEALVMASIIEKETGRKDERERVAAVFVNRLRQNMRLQSDPTILYGLYGGQVNWGKPIQRNEINARNAHNTYQINGLPPSPICNPGRASIMSALKPAETKDLFFVADGQGGHVFSETLKDHNTAVKDWRKIEKDMRARQNEKAAARVAPAAAPEPEPAPAPVPAAAAATASIPLPVRKPSTK